MTTIDTRREQMFPRLDAAEIERLERFGERRRYADGERLFEAGSVGPGMFVVLTGAVRIAQRDGLGHTAVIVEQGPGQFLAEVGQLSGAVAFVDGVAVGAVEALLIVPDRLRALLVAEAEVGERIMRALILRRVSLIESGAGGPVLIGGPRAAAVAQLSSFLTRNGYPHQVLDIDADAGAKELAQRLAPTADELPLVVLTDGAILRRPSEADLAARLGMVGKADCGRRYDVAIVGAGPAGLAAAVYASSEGLSVLALDLRAFGGQAGASMRIENFLGFPTGISGQALAGRALVQAQKFGTRIAIPVEVKRLVCDGDGAVHALELGDGSRLEARAVVVASGARYRRPAIDRLREFEGNGVWYWASPIEAQLCQGADVALVGGGNSAGQAAVFLSTKVRSLALLVRGARIEDGMSQYLVDRIKAAPNITVLPRTEVTGLDGSAERGLQQVRWKTNGADETRPIRHLFLFIGADPATEWLAGCDVALDDKGFVRTGADAGAGAPRSDLETSVAGVFAIGDVRSGSVKRVGGAIGEGAAVVQALHRYLAEPAAA